MCTVLERCDGLSVQASVCRLPLLQIPPGPQQVVALDLQLADHNLETPELDPVQNVDAFFRPGE
jgi:hypothetical protein